MHKYLTYILYFETTLYHNFFKNDAIVTTFWKKPHRVTLNIIHFENIVITCSTPKKIKLSDSSLGKF